MTQYSYTQLENLWDNNGGPPDLAPTMAAIALAESSGDPTSTNPTDNGGTQTSWGLWQISDGTHNQPVPNILDPNVNAAAAVAKYHSQGLRAWGTYDTGAFRKYLNGANSPPATADTPAAPAGSALASSGGGSSKNTCVIKLPSATIIPGVAHLGGGCLLAESELKALKGGALVVAGGAVFVVGALVLVAYGLGQTGAGRTASKALQVTPVGRGATTAGRAATARTAGSQSRTARARGGPSPAARRNEARKSQADLEDRLNRGKVQFGSGEDDDELFESTRGSGRANRAGYRRALGAPRDIRARRSAA